MKKSYHLEDLCCANCAAKMERKLAEVPGVERATVNFLSGRLTFECAEERVAEVEAAMEKIVHKVEPDVKIKAV